MMDLFFTWTSSSTLTNPRMSTENLHTTIPVPPHPPNTVSSDPLKDEPASTLKKNWTPSTQLPYKMDTP